MKIIESNLYDYQSVMIGNKKIEFFTEKMDSPCEHIEKYEFFYKIDESTTKTINFFINDLYKIYTFIQKNLTSLIDDFIDNINYDKVIELIIEAESENESELKQKNKLYDYHLERLANNITNNNSDIICNHTKNGYVHTLSFMKLKHI